MHVFTLVLQAGWQHTKECHGDVGSPPVLGPWKGLSGSALLQAGVHSEVPTDAASHSEPN